jgi:hypothetical protein
LFCKRKPGADHNSIAYNMRSVVDSAYSFFAFSINTINVGRLLQYSGQISSNVTAYGSRSANVHKRPTVERSEINPDGGHTYLVTFPESMGNV